MTRSSSLGPGPFIVPLPPQLEVLLELLSFNRKSVEIEGRVVYHPDLITLYLFNSDGLLHPSAGEEQAERELPYVLRKLFEKNFPVLLQLFVKTSF